MGLFSHRSPKGLGTRRGTKKAKKLSMVACATTLFLLMMAALLIGCWWQVADPLAPPLSAIHNELTGAVDAAAPVTIAYAISLIKCGNYESSAAGLTDAAMVLRHSVHQTSIRNPASGSKYDYKMYAIVHRQAEECSHILADAGFHILIRDPPVNKNDIEGDFLREHIHREWCCGSDEFVKLYAYMIEDVPIVVHVDIDFAFFKPMDDLFDAMLNAKDSPQGKAARTNIAVERPKDSWPDRIDCFMTRDWPQVMPGRKAAHQAGFLVVRPDKKVFDTIVEVIRKGDYVDGFQVENGWGGKGYGGFVGAMAMQGLLAYVYDILLPDTWVELNQCRYNHMGMDTLYRAHPSFRPNHKKVGQCRNNLDYCEDCLTTEVDKIYHVHYTMCRKPWNCIGEGDKSGNAPAKLSIPEDQVRLGHCMELLTLWHNYRTDLETKMMALTGDETIKEGQTGDYKKEVFQGHCTGNNEYITLAGKKESYKRLPELYSDTASAS